MSGILGTNAALITDVTLLVQVISFLILLAGLVFKTKGKLKMHGSLMGIAVFFHLLSFLIGMAPRFVSDFEFFTTDTSLIAVQVMWVHAIAGGVALILGIALVVAWIIQSSNLKGCIRRKRLMDVTVMVWTVSLAFGMATYLTFYL